MRPRMQEIARHWEAFTAFFEKAYMRPIFEFLGGSEIDQIEYHCLVFTRNLQVSSCGVFPEDAKAFNSSIAYNLISYSDMSILVLTIFKVVEHYLD